MKKRQFIFSNRKSELLVFWQTKKEIHLLGQYGEIMTEDVVLFLMQLEEDLESGELVYIGDL